MPTGDLFQRDVAHWRDRDQDIVLEDLFPDVDR